MNNRRKPLRYRAQELIITLAIGLTCAVVFFFTVALIIV